ncbi:EamA family transporter [Amycolatopsis nigrescens]|uniref:EamA family transporter n=1 Tax=Amycolatopsis nigrescens TaxID=381445 RepID=UPI000372C403|nr:EamA family transporter [Amycolatopsis nigrescens]
MSLDQVPRLRPSGGFGRFRPPAPVLVLCSVLSVQFGQAFGKSLFGTVTPSGVVTLRLGLAALLLLAIYRPRLPRDRVEWPLVLGFGTAIAGMNLIYLALARLPVGVAMTVQLLGPLAVALAASRRPLDFVWSALAVGGLLLFMLPGTDVGRLSPAGLALALPAAVAMGGYVLLSKRAGTRSADGSVLALALVWATLLWAPFGIVHNGPDLLRPGTLLFGLGVAVLSAALPYSLELAALRELSPRVVGILQSLEPAAGAGAGFLVLAETLTGTQLGAMGCVSAAAIAAVLTSRERRSLARKVPTGRYPWNPAAIRRAFRRSSASDRPGRTSPSLLRLDPLVNDSQDPNPVGPGAHDCGKPPRDS